MQYTPAAGNRPDISMGRGTMFREGGVDMSAPYENVKTQDRSMRQQPPPMPSNENVQGPRPEMRGPQNMDLNGLLSGLKTREVNIHEQQPQNTPFTGQSALRDNDSMVSIASLQDSQNMAMPKRTNRRKQKSDRNTISLDI
jgi:hypothetical protein